MKKKVNVAHTQKFIDFEGKPHDVVRNLSFVFSKNDTDNTWVMKCSDEYLTDLIDFGNRYGLSITTEEQK